MSDALPTLPTPTDQDVIGVACVHIKELRKALDEALQILGQQVPDFRDSEKHRALRKAMGMNPPQVSIMVTDAQLARLRVLHAAKVEVFRRVERLS